MKRLFVILLLFMIKVGHAQSKPASNEDFVNTIFPLVGDSSATHYYLFSDAHACSFKKYDYDEWYKYALNEAVPVYILDEIDAALDLSHTANLGHMIREHFPQSQFIVVSLKDGMFNNATVLYKVSFFDGGSKVERIAKDKEDLLPKKKGIKN